MDRIFYHGGLGVDFDLDQLDIFRPANKQQNKSHSYVGFYMYGEQNKDDAFRYAQCCDDKSRGVIKLILDGDLKIYEVPPFTITRVTKEQLELLIKQGYDLLAGKMLGKMEYVLLNKDKIKKIEFLPLETISSFDDSTVKHKR